MFYVAVAEIKGNLKKRFVAISLYVQSLLFRSCRLSELTLAEPLISVLVINLGFTVKIVTICHHFLPVKLKFTKNSSPVFQDQAETSCKNDHETNFFYRICLKYRKKNTTYVADSEQDSQLHCTV